MTKDKALKLALESLENLKEVVAAAQALGIKAGATGKDMRLGESFLHDEAITAIKATLAQPVPDLTEQQRELYQKGHNDGVAHHKQAVKAAQPEQELTGIREIRVTETVKPKQEPLTDEQLEQRIGYRLPAYGFDAIRQLIKENT